MIHLLRRANHLLHFLWGDGSWRLTALEQQIIDAVVEILPGSIAEVARRQLEQDFFVERIPAGRINVIRYYDFNDDSRISEPDYADKLFKVRISVDGKAQTAHVTFYKGRIFSVEFPKPRRSYTAKKVVIRDVVEGSPKESYTHVIDRAEHGISAT